MTNEQEKGAQPTSRKLRLSVDWWAVITALMLAALLRVGLIHNVPW